MSLELVTNIQRWQQIYDRLPDFHGKVYYSPQYYQCFEANGDGKATALFYEQGDTQIFYPFLCRAIPDSIGGNGCIDLETAYGYGGPAIFAHNESSIKDFFQQFADWAAKHQVVAEFVRFNPFILSQPQLANFYQVSLNRTTVSIDLRQTFAHILSACSAPRRRNYQRANAVDLQLHSEESLDVFRKLYLSTMQRLAAEPYYFFTDEYFARLEQMDGSNRLFVSITTNSGEIAAAGVFLLDQTSAHYHLGASNPEFKSLQPNAFMILATAKMARQQNKQLLHLGGGLSLAADDSLMRFKTGFSPQRQPFFIGKKIHDPARYQRFSQAWQHRTNQQPQILLHYHYGV